MGLSTNNTNTEEPNFLAQILLKVMIIKSMLKRIEVLYDMKNKIINDVFAILPKCKYILL